MNEVNKNIKDLIEPGFDLAGNSAGSAIGAVAGGAIAGPPGIIIGAVGGAAISAIFSKAGKEIKERFLSKRETERIGAVSLFAIDKINENFNAGQLLRDDDFFQKESEGIRSAADEILEKTLIAAQRETEENKIKYFGNLLGNISFHAEVGKIEANRLIRIAQDLSFNQMCILAFVNEIQKPHSENNSCFRGKNIKLKEGYIYYKNDHDDFRFGIFANELEELSSKKLVGTLGNISSGSTVPKSMQLTPIGQKLCDLMELKKIDTDTVYNSIEFMLDRP
jgi:hypothetical protein